VPTQIDDSAAEVEPVPAVAEELRQRHAGERLDLLVWVLVRYGTQKPLVAPVKAENGQTRVPCSNEMTRNVRTMNATVRSRFHKGVKRVPSA
jgi:hypothetical protein